MNPLQQTQKTASLFDLSPSSSLSSAVIYSYENATLYTMEDHHFGPLKQGRLMVYQGKILWVGTEEEGQEIEANLLDKIQKSSQEIQRIDCTGEHICPGFVDAHAHLGLYPEGFIGEPKDLNELTQSLTPHLNALNGIWPGDIAFKKAREGGVTTVCIIPGSANVIGGVGAVLKTQGIDVEEMVVKNPACLKIAFGYNVKNSHGVKGRAPLTRMALYDMMYQAFEDALEYEQKILVNPELKRDRGKDHLVMALNRQIPVRAHASRSDDILSAIRLAKHFGFDLVIEHGYEATAIQKQLQSVSAQVVYGPAFRTCGHSEDLNFDFADAQVLLKAGIKVAQMTDHPIVPIQHLSLQAGLCMREGLDAYNALRLVTSYPADILRCNDQVGRLQIGLDADFLRLDGPPLTMERRLLKVYFEGKELSKS